MGLDVSLYVTDVNTYDNIITSLNLCTCARDFDADIVRYKSLDEIYTLRSAYSFRLLAKNVLNNLVNWDATEPDTNAIYYIPLSMDDLRYFIKELTTIGSEYNEMVKLEYETFRAVGAILDELVHYPNNRALVSISY
jgi:hypothetical protein